MHRVISWAFVFLGFASCLLAEEKLISPAAIVHSEFIYETAPFPQCHASTIVETPTGLVAAWFGGEHEKHPQVGIWVSRRGKGTDGKWTAPVEVANGKQSEEKRHPCWNPVLFQPRRGVLWLFF